MNNLIKFFFLLCISLASTFKAGAFGLTEKIFKNREDIELFLLKNHPPVNDKRVLFEMVSFFLTSTEPALKQLEAGLSDAEVSKVYKTHLSQEQIAAAPVLLLPQRHDDRDGVVSNYILMNQLLKPDSQVLLEGFTPDENINLLKAFLGHVAFIDDLPKRPHVQFGTEIALRLRSHYELIAGDFVKYIVKNNHQFPLALSFARGWDAPLKNTAERNHLLLSVIQSHLQEKKRVIVHLGGAHAPSFYENYVRSIVKKATGNDYSTSIYNDATLPLLMSIVKPEVAAVLYSMTKLKFGLPPGTLELLPSTKLTRDLLGKQAEKKHLCQKCGQTAEKHCGACKTTHYCGADCQKSDWPSHKSICAGAGKQEKH